MVEFNDTKKKSTNSKSKKWTVNKVSIDDDVGDVCVNQMIIEVINETEPKIRTKTRTKNQDRDDGEKIDEQTKKLIWF